MDVRLAEKSSGLRRNGLAKGREMPSGLFALLKRPVKALVVVAVEVRAGVRAYQ